MSEETVIGRIAFPTVSNPPVINWPRTVSDMAKDLASLRAENERLKAEIGVPLFDDEVGSRDETWHHERYNWNDEVDHLREEIETLKEDKRELVDAIVNHLFSSSPSDIEILHVAVAKHRGKV